MQESSGIDKSATADNHIFLAISKSAINGSPAARTIKLWGNIQNHNISILIDSRSTSSFISATIEQQLEHVISVPIFATIQVAGGGIL
jgi:hypothetical protein